MTQRLPVNHLDGMLAFDTFRAILTSSFLNYAGCKFAYHMVFHLVGLKHHNCFYPIYLPLHQQYLILQAVLIHL